jgi:hypothetical protein
VRALAIAFAVLFAREAAAQEEPRLFHVPTAYLAPEWGARASGGGSFHATTAVGGENVNFWGEVATGVLKVADLEVTLGDEIRANGSVVAMPTAQFRMGVGEGRLADWQPALALGFRRSLATIDDLDAAELWVAASRRVFQFTIHAGGGMWDAAVRGGKALHDGPLADSVRPFAGLEWRPPWYPKTTMLGEWSWVPEITSQSIDMHWLAGAGVRYHAFDWLSLDLAARFRENDGLGKTSVMVRFNVAVAPLRAETH